MSPYLKVTYYNILYCILNAYEYIIFNMLLCYNVLHTKVCYLRGMLRCATYILMFVINVCYMYIYNIM